MPDKNTNAKNRTEAGGRLDRRVTRWLIRRVHRMRFKVKLNESRYSGKEAEYTFHGGFESGYAAGRLSAFEDIADELRIDIAG